MQLTSPHITPENAPFWAAANQRQLLLRRCLDTGKVFHYPRDHSPFTGSTAVDWIVASGQGTLYSFSYNTRSCIAYVTLDEGPTVLSAIDCENPQQLQIGQRLSVAYAATPDGQMVPVFVPMLDSPPKVTRHAEVLDSRTSRPWPAVSCSSLATPPAPASAAP